MKAPLEGNEVEENGFCPYKRVGLETGDSVKIAPARNTPLESLEGELSPVSCDEVDGIRE